MSVTKAAQLVYLLKGDLGLRFNNDNQVILRGGSPAARHPLSKGHKVKGTVVLTDIEILRIDTDLLDIMMTWDRLSSVGLHQQADKKPVDVINMHEKSLKIGCVKRMYSAYQNCKKGYLAAYRLRIFNKCLNG